MRLRVTSVLQVPRDVMFEELQKISRMREVMSPMMRVEPVGDRESTGGWEPGEEYPWKIYLLGFIPLGEHRIKLVSKDRENYQMVSEEGGAAVKVWNHTITLEDDGSGDTIYTDYVEIDAGWKTPFIWLFANLFYRYRQRKWRKIAGTL